MSPLSAFLWGQIGVRTQRQRCQRGLQTGAAARAAKAQPLFKPALHNLFLGIVQHSKQIFVHRSHLCCQLSEYFTDTLALGRETLEESLKILKDCQETFQAAECFQNGVFGYSARCCRIHFVAVCFLARRGLARGMILQSVQKCCCAVFRIGVLHWLPIGATGKELLIDDFGDINDPPKGRVTDSTQAAEHVAYNTREEAKQLLQLWSHTESFWRGCRWRRRSPSHKSLRLNFAAAEGGIHRVTVSPDTELLQTCLDAL
mmetsp:Transcript_24244/g.53849  ORF Transcript_24244/g.53849 Transcript_24244/m.53849 type:complete len:259 (+) Transcript_24244:391-1167(+)